MRDLEWEKLRRLQGGPRRNWEILCREVVRRHYQRFGPLLTRKQQPGVEFHLELERECELGEPGRHWGWQCKWFEPESFDTNGRLRSGQRAKIEDAIEKSARHVEGLTDWVLWTRDKLGADDCRWFEALEAPFTLHRWDGETLLGLLSGPAAMLRETWFGELVLDQARLTENRREALAPIRHRYLEELHLRTPTELETEELLLGRHLESQLLMIEAELERESGRLEAVAEEARGESLGPLHGEVSFALAEVGASVEELRKMLKDGRLPTADEVESLAGESAQPRQADGVERVDDFGLAVDELIEYGNSDPGWTLRAAVSALSSARELIARLAEGLRTPMLVVLGGAGAGKTHLAASLTGPDEAARGVLVLGRQFGTQIEDDDLARFSGLASTRDDLLEALDALGAREERRVPLVIDGINESDDPAAWEVALARLCTKLETLDHIFVVVTVRPSYRRMALPQNLPTVDLAGLAGLEEKAVERYFDHYRIDAAADAIHWWRPSDPLMLSIFCRTVNPERRQTVRATELPESLTEVFDAYLDAACIRVAKTMRIPEEDVATAVMRLAEHCFWADANHLDRDDVAKALGDSGRAQWRDSLRFQLEAEEILIRDVVGNDERVAWSYDLLAGHVLAKTLLRRFDPRELAGEEVSAVLESHPLGEDVIAGLAGILGDRGQELTAILEARPGLAVKAAMASVRLPASQVGEATVGAIRRLFEEHPQEGVEVLLEASLRRGHPLDAHFLDGLLGELEVERRDRTWTDWMQVHFRTHQQVCSLAEGWRLGQEVYDDEVAIAWLSWVLTATDRRLRDAAIQALYRAGRKEPTLLFARTLAMLGTNDPAIAEGLMAAAYGVVMASQDPSPETLDAVLKFAAAVQARLLADDATEPTFHWLIREYAYRTAQFASWITDGEFEALHNAAQPPLPQPAVTVSSIAPGEAGWYESEGEAWLKRCEKALRSLPANYRDRVALDRRLQEISGEIRARVAELGWRRDPPRPFDQPETDPKGDPEPVDLGEEWGRRFGEKYGSTALYEALGRLSDNRELRTRPLWRIREPPLDPSYPESAALEPLGIPDWRDAATTDLEWIEDGGREVPVRLLYGHKLEGDRFVAVSGYLWRSRHRTGRSSFWTIRGVLALDGWPSIKGVISDLGGDATLVPDDPVERACFAGEAPWAPTFDSAATNADGSFDPHIANLGGYPGDGPRVELLSVELRWPNERSPLNTAVIGPLPNKAFSHHAGLRKVAERPELIDGAGRLAARTVSPRGVDGCDGRLLYVREDLLRAYCAERGGEWGWLVWEERRLDGDAPGGGAIPSARQQLRTVSLDELTGGIIPKL